MFKIVVGERFRSSTHNVDYISIDEYKQLWASMPETFFIPGQGISAAEREMILAQNPQQIEQLLASHVLPQCRKKVHKSQQQNVVISALTPVADKAMTFQAGLLVDNENELILDHVSGFHVPGMIFLEATRQLAMSAWELINGMNVDAKSMIMKDISANYLDFAYLIPTHIETRLQKINGDQYHIFVNYSQNDRVVVKTQGTFKVSDKHKVQRLEALLMKKHTGYQIAQFTEKLKKQSELQEI